MATNRELLREAQGVALTRVTLRADGGIVETTYTLSTLRYPEAKHFNSLAEADAEWLAEVDRSQNDPLVQQRLRR